MTNYLALVSAGARLLDQKSPDWRQKISTGNLVMFDGERCVLGQLFGGYGAGLDTLEIDSGKDYGFYITDENGEWLPQWAALRDAWINEINNY